MISFKFWALILLAGAGCLVSCARPRHVGTTPPARARGNGIYLNTVKVYDEGSLESLLKAASANLAQLNGFDQASLISHLGAIQGSTANQSQNSLQVTGPASAAAPNNSAAPAAPATYTLPSTFQTSAGDFLNEQMQLSLQMVNMQLLLQGSLNDQMDQGGTRKTRTTLGFPINIRVPLGFRYQGAVAEVEVSVCAPTGLDEPSLVTLLPQEKTYNVASLVSKSSSIGGGAIAGIVSVGGNLLRSRQTYYLVKDQDTLAMQRTPPGVCEGGKTKPVTFAWQFRPVLGQPVVSDGLRQTFAQVSFPRKTNECVCNAAVTVRTAWRHYDARTGRMGDLIDPYEVHHLRAEDFDNPPDPRYVFASDNGDGNVSVRAMGAFKAATRVRIGGTVLDNNSTANGFEQNESYIRFTAPAFSLAMYDAYLLNQDGTEAPVAITPLDQPRRSERCEVSALTCVCRCPAQVKPSISLNPTAGEPGQPLTVGITGTATHFTDGKPTVRFSNAGVIAKTVTVADDTHMSVSLNIAKDAVPGLSNVTVGAGWEITTGAALLLVGQSTASIVSVTPTTGAQGQTFPIKITGSATHFKAAAPMVTFSNPGVRPNAIQVIDDSTLKLTLNIAPTAAPGPWDVTVVTGAETARGASLFNVTAFTPCPNVASIEPAEGQRGTIHHAYILGVFPDFGRTTPTLTFSKAGITAQNVAVVDNTALAADLVIASNAEAGMSDVTVGTGAATVTGIELFLVRGAEVKPFSDTTSLVTLTLGPGDAPVPDQPDVVLIGNHAFGLRDAPFYERTDDHVRLLVTNDLIRTNHQVIWKRLFSTRSKTYPILFPPPAPTGVSDFAIASVKLVSYTAGGAGSGSAATSLASDVTVMAGFVPVAGAGLFTIGNGNPAITGISQSSGRRGETLPVIITGAFTHFGQGISGVTFSNKVVAGGVTALDDTHLSANLAVDAGASDGPSNITVVTPAETAVGSAVFTVESATKRITGVAPASGEPSSAPFPVTITGDSTHFKQAVPDVKFGNLGVVASNVTATNDTQLTATVTIAANAKPGLSSITVLTGAGRGPETAGGTRMFTVSPGAPSISSISPASGQPGQTLSVVITGVKTHFTTATPLSLTFSSGVTATNIAAPDDTHITATLDISPSALATASPAPSGSAAPQKSTNTYAISGSRLKDLKIEAPAGVGIGPVNEETVVTFSLTDEQAKATKSIVVRHGTDEPVVLALPDPPAAAGTAATPAKPSIKAQPVAGIASGLQTLTVTGTGMSQVVDIQYQDRPIKFTSNVDTSLTLTFLFADNGNPVPLSSPGIDVVFFYADKSKAQYFIPVQKSGPQ